MRRLDANDLFNIANGATFLASGGGGSVKTAYSFIAELLKLNADVELASLNELDESQVGCVVGAMGSPESFEKVGLNGAESRAVDAINDNIDSTLSFTIPVETGANLFVAMLAAAKKFAQPIMVDADGAGRSVPTLSCLSFSNVVNATPFALLNAAHGDQGGGYVAGNLLLNLKDTRATEQAKIVEMVARPVLATKGSFDGIAAIAGWHMNGAQANDALIAGCISKALDLGQVLSSERDDKKVIGKLAEFLTTSCDSPLYNLSASQAPFLLEKIERSSSGGFDYNRMYFKQGDVKLVVINQNENLLVWNTLSPNPMTICPDLICMLGKLDTSLQSEIKDKLSGLNESEVQSAQLALQGWHGLSVEDLTEGQEVYLFGVATNNKNPTYVKTFNELAQQFGYFGPYKPISELLPKEEHQ